MLLSLACCVTVAVSFVGVFGCFLSLHAICDFVSRQIVSSNGSMRLPRKNEFQ